MLGVEPIPETTTANGGRPSALDRIRAKHKAAQGNKHLDLEVPGYDGELGVRYRAIDEDDIGRLEAATGNIKAQVEANLDGLIAACQCIVVRGDDGKLEPLTHGGEPVYFDDNLVEILDLEVGDNPTVREIVLAVFSTLPAPYMGASQHAEKIVKWMAGVEEDSLGGLLGKS